jgi:hypothetical protein
VFKSTDGGATWSSTSLTRTVWALAIDPQNPNILYAGTERWGRVFKSTDGGATWSGTSLTRTVWALAIDPQNPNILYAGKFLWRLYSRAQMAEPLGAAPA